MWHAVVETPTFLAAAHAAGLAEVDRDAIVVYLAMHPDAGTPMPGTGGARKVRFAGRGKGKSGGYRVVTFYSGANIPVFLLHLVSKGERTDLSQRERNELKKELVGMVDDYNRGGERHGKVRTDTH